MDRSTTSIRRITLDDEGLAAYERDGFAPLGRILDDDELEALTAAELAHRPAQPYAAAGTTSALLVRDQLVHQSSAVRRFVTGGAHLGAVVQLLGPDVAFTHTQFITKLPEGDADRAAGTASSIPLHQDDGYGTLDPPLDVTVWTALTDTDETNGCLVIIPGSHRLGLVDHARDPDNPALRVADGDGAVPVPLPAGHAVIFHGFTLHGSGPNRSDRPRLGMHARYCHPAVRMVTEGGRPVLEDPHSWMVAGEATDVGLASANDKFITGRV